MNSNIYSYRRTPQFFHSLKTEYNIWTHFFTKTIKKLHIVDLYKQLRNPFLVPAEIFLVKKRILYLKQVFLQKQNALRNKKKRKHTKKEDNSPVRNDTQSRFKQDIQNSRDFKKSKGGKSSRIVKPYE